jgi:hypothetical protein
MTCNNNCIYLGTKFLNGVGNRPVCGKSAGDVIYLYDGRTICESYKTNKPAEGTTREGDA